MAWFGCSECDCRLQLSSVPKRNSYHAVAPVRHGDGKGEPAAVFACPPPLLSVSGTYLCRTMLAASCCDQAIFASSSIHEDNHRPPLGQTGMHAILKHHAKSRLHQAHLAVSTRGQTTTGGLLQAGDSRFRAGSLDETTVQLSLAYGIVPMCRSVFLVKPLEVG